MVIKFKIKKINIFNYIVRVFLDPFSSIPIIGLISIEMIDFFKNFNITYPTNMAQIFSKNYYGSATYKVNIFNFKKIYLLKKMFEIFKISESDE